MKTTLTTLILSLFALAATRIVAVEGGTADKGCCTKAKVCACADCKCTGADGEACKCKTECCKDGKCAGDCCKKPACACADCKCTGAEGEACKCKTACCKDGCKKDAAAKAGCCDKPKA